MYLWRKSAARRWLNANEERLGRASDGWLVVVERLGRKQIELEVCCRTKKEARRFANEFGGRIERLPRVWLKRFSQEQGIKAVKIGKRLLILRSRGKRKTNSLPYSLIIPAGAAFGTADHATTAMSLRLLEKTSRTLKLGWSMVDLGTGSGILALAAKRFGAGRIIGIDNDPRAIATARENARMNKIDNVDFKIGDLRRCKFSRRVDIITANLFSELLIEILPKLKGAERLILSGILRGQKRDLTRALRLHKIDIVEERRRGKWVALLAICSGAL